MTVDANEPHLRRPTKQCPVCEGDGMVQVGHGLKARELWCGECHGDGFVPCDPSDIDDELEEG